VALRLGFENTSFFGKYFKKHFGCTPMEYRISHSLSSQTPDIPT
jgi:AraC-like DNA-binding protein